MPGISHGETLYVLMSLAFHVVAHASGVTWSEF